MPSQFSGQSQFGTPAPLQLLSQFNAPMRGIGVGYQPAPGQIDPAMLERLRRQQQLELQQQLRLQLLGSFQGR